MSVDLEDLIGEFETRFDKPPVWGASAPGRVNLIGEHIDYNGGWVFPAAINRETTVLAGPSRDNRFRIHSTSYDTPYSWPSEELPVGQVEPSWANYFLGTFDQMEMRGYTLPPVEVLIGSDVPTAAGLSSSAALEVSLFTLFGSILGIEISGHDKALWSQAADHGDRLRIRSGIMDQFVSANAVAGHALKLDCGTLDFTLVPLSPDRISILIVHSTVPRELVISAYNERRLQCETALKHLNGVSGRTESFLVGYSPGELDLFGKDLDETLRKRAKHVVTEQVRVEAFENSLNQGNLEKMGHLLSESHRSLRDDYEVSCAELDAIQEIAGTIHGVYGSRLTGAGFGGCAIALVDPARVESIAREIETRFETEIGRRPWTLATTARGGARTLDL